MDLQPIGQPPEENIYDYFHASKVAVRIKIGLRLGAGLGFGSVLPLGLVSGNTGYILFCRFCYFKTYTCRN